MITKHDSADERWSCRYCRDSGIMLSIVAPDESTPVHSLNPNEPIGARIFRPGSLITGPPLRVELCGCVRRACGNENGRLGHVLRNLQSPVSARFEVVEMGDDFEEIVCSVASKHLKPCPFCFSLPTFQKDGVEYWMGCECGAQGPKARNPRQAVLKWNSRVRCPECLVETVDLQVAGTKPGPNGVQARFVCYRCATPKEFRQ